MVCPARERSCNNCGLNGNFAKHCRSTGRQQVQTNVVEQTNTEAEGTSQHQDTNAEPEFQVNFDDFRIMAIGEENKST